MKNFLLSIFFAGAFVILSFSSLYAQDSTKTEKKEEPVKHEQHFIDKDGDGYNDNAPDHDGDGIPNGLDPDWKKQNEEKRKRQRFVDLDGDGINDNIHGGDDPQKDQNENIHGQKEGSSLEKKTKDQQQKQQKKQRGKP
jgi:hypothetical protein